MCVSGVFIVLYSIGMRDYQRTAQELAAEHFAAEAQRAERILPEDALVRIEEVFPGKDVISMRLPTAEREGTMKTSS